MGTEVVFYDLPAVEVELPGYLHVGIQGETGATFTPNVDEDGILSWENDKDLPNPESVDLKLLLEIAAAEDLAQIRQDIADLQYREIQILSITASVSVAELGSTVNVFEVAWETNKTPVSMQLNGAAVEIGEGATVFGWSTNEAGITADKNWKVYVQDERGAEDTAAVTVKFLNGVYYGALAHAAEVDSAGVLGMHCTLQSGRGVEFTVIPSKGKRPAYACPTRYGTPTFKIGGLTYEWEKVSTFDFTNASGYTESYDVWMHGQDVPDTITVSVS